MLHRAERLLEEYAEAKLALMSCVTTSYDDDDDNDDSGRGVTTHSSISTANSHGHSSRNSSSSNSKAGRKSHMVSHNSSRQRENPASSRVAARHPVRGSSASRVNPASRENRGGAKLAAEQSERSHDDRCPLGTINRESNLLILGQHTLPPLPSDCFHQPRAHLRN